jgi:hypothetical protein
MYINWKKRELVITLALYGPLGSGKSTTWRFLAQGAVDSLAQGVDNFSLRLEKIQGKQLILNLRDTPGQETAASQRRVALYGVDGLIFVIDSDPARQAANRQSLNELEHNLSAMGKTLWRMPLLFQYNKRDLPDALSIVLCQELFNPQGLPYQETCADSGEGLVELLQQATDLVLRTIA